MVIDFEHHYIPAELGRKMGLDPTKKEPVRTRDATVHSQLFDMEAQLCDMDRVGIDIAVQSCILGWDTTLENCRLINDCTAQMQKDYPKRFVGLAHAPVLEDGGLGELERAVSRLGLKGVTISSQVNGLSLDAKELTPFYDLMNQLGASIFVHPALAPKGYSLMLDYQLPVILTREFDLGVAVTRLIAGGVVERFPNVLAHAVDAPPLPGISAIKILRIVGCEYHALRFNPCQRAAQCNRAAFKPGHVKIEPVEIFFKRLGQLETIGRA